MHKPRGDRSRRTPRSSCLGRLAPEPFADAVRLARETGLRIGDLVELERSEIKSAPGGGRAVVLRPNKRRNRIVNMPLTAAAEAIIDKAPLLRAASTEKTVRAEAWGAVHLSREVRDYATCFGIRPGVAVQRPPRHQGDRARLGRHQRARTGGAHGVGARDRRKNGRRLRRAKPGPRHGGRAPRAGEAGTAPPAETGQRPLALPELKSGRVHSGATELLADDLGS